MMPDQGRARPRPVEILLLAHLGWVLLTPVLPRAGGGADLGVALPVVLDGAVLPCVAYGVGHLIGRLVLGDRRRLRWLLGVVVAATVCACGVALAGVGVGVGGPSPVSTGLLLVVGVVVCLLLVERGGLPWAVRLPLGGVAAVATVAAVLTRSAAVVLGLVVAVVLGAVVARGWRRGFVGVGVLGALVLAVAGGVEVRGRLDPVVAALDAIGRQPLTGVGPGRFAAWAHAVDPTRRPDLLPPGTVLGAAAEVGLPGLVLGAAVLVTITVVLVGAARARPADAPWAQGTVVALGAVAAVAVVADLRPLPLATALPAVLVGAAVSALDRPDPAGRRSWPLAPVPSSPLPSGRPAWTAIVGGGAVVLVAYLVAVLPATGRRLDTEVMRSAGHAYWKVRDAIHAALDIGLVPAALVLTALVAVAHLHAGRRDDAVHTVVLVVGAEVVTQTAKLILPRPGGENTLPSGHETLVAAVALVALLATPPALRWLVGTAGVAAVLVVAAGTWTIGWHRPSDVIAALGVVAVCWGALDRWRWRRARAAAVTRHLPRPLATTGAPRQPGP